MLWGGFQAAFACLSGVLQGDAGDQSLAVLYFQADFFLRGAFMLCNVWDVLAPLQQWDYKFCLRHGGLIHTQTHTSRYTQAEVSSQTHTITSHKSQHQKEMAGL